MAKHNKVIIRVQGGLGNQLFCYAATRRLALANNAELVIDDVTGFARDRLYNRQYALDKFQITARKAAPRERMEPFERYRRGMAKFIAQRRPFHLRRYVEQEGIDFDPRLLEYRVNGTVYLDGLWQSEDYFKDVENVIRNDLKIIPPKDKENKDMAERIRASSNAVAVHFRCFESPNSQSAAHNLDKRYYVQAVKEVCAKVKEHHFFLFSDNPDAARKLLDLPEDSVTAISHNQGDKNAYADLWLMSLCKHFVIANSTFSWWGGWLSRNEHKIVVAPRIVQSGISSWGFNGLIPKEWIQIKTAIDECT